MSRRFDAVVFDLFGTLVSEFPTAEWDAHFAELGRALGVDPRALRVEWEASSEDRQTGRLGDIEENLREMCRRLGLRPSDQRIGRALGVRRSLYARCWRTMPGALETVARVRERGLGTALVSQCAPDTPETWRSSALAGSVDVEVFSSEVGFRKPEPRIYLAAAERLGTPAERCLYVGDGSYGELRGAAALGMFAVLVRDPNEVEGSMLRPGFEPWSGATVTSIAEVPTLIERMDQSSRTT